MEINAKDIWIGLVVYDSDITTEYFTAANPDVNDVIYDLYNYYKYIVREEFTFITDNLGVPIPTDEEVRNGMGLTENWEDKNIFISNIINKTGLKINRNWPNIRGPYTTYDFILVKYNFS